MKDLLKRLLGYGGHTAILLYHRVDSPEYDPWDLAVSPNDFEAQLMWLKKHSNIQPLSEISKNPGYKGIRPRIGICFDDGYLDNFVYATPLLQTHGVPATFFISTHYVQTGDTFWWDRLAAIFFEPRQLPPKLFIQTGTDMLELFFEEPGMGEQDRQELFQWKAENPPPNERAANYLKAWAWLKQKNYSEISSHLQEMERQVDRSISLGRVAMDRNEVLELSKMPGISIGAHTLTHPALRSIGDRAEAEIRDSVYQLREWTGGNVELFSYPYGDVDDSVVKIAKSVDGLKAAFSTERKAVESKVNLFLIPRFAVSGNVESVQSIVDLL